MIYKGSTSKSVSFGRPRLKTFSEKKLEKKASWPSFMAAAFLSVISLTIKPNYARAQALFDNCRPPLPGEYLVLISTPTPESQQAVLSTLPSDIDIGLCRYVDRVVARIGRFGDRALADDWRRYVEGTIGLSAYVVEPTTSGPSGTSRSLGAGYAVLVDSSERPETAAELQRLLGRDLGLVLYGGKNFFLVTYTPSANDAVASLKRVSDRGFFTFIVDSSRVTLIN